MTQPFSLCSCLPSLPPSLFLSLSLLLPLSSLLSSLPCQDLCKYKLEKRDLVVSELFQLFDSARAKIGILDWGVKMTTLEDGKGVGGEGRGGGEKGEVGGEKGEVGGEEEERRGRWEERRGEKGEEGREG